MNTTPVKDRRKTKRKEDLLRNRVLGLLEDDTLRLIEPELERVKLELGFEALHPGQALQYAYFPTSSIFSVTIDTESGKSAEIGVIGSEGFVGIPLVMGADTSTTRIHVSHCGYAYRVRASVFKKLIQTSDDLQAKALLSSQLFMAQISTNGGCYRHHTVEQQLARVYLSTADRLHTDLILISQEGISTSLGVRRESITEVASRYRNEGLIQYARGRIKLLNRHALEANACECYFNMKRETEKLFAKKDTSRHQTYSIA